MGRGGVSSFRVVSAIYQVFFVENSFKNASCEFDRFSGPIETVLSFSLALFCV